MHSQRVGEMIWKDYDCELVVEDLKKSIQELDLQTI